MSKGRHKLGWIARPPGGTNDYQKAQASEITPTDELSEAEVVGEPQIGPRFRARGKAMLSRRPHVEALLGVSYAIAWEELKRLEEKAKFGQLDKPELDRYHKLVDAVTRIAREERDQDKEDPIEDIPLEKLIELVEQAKGILKK